MLLLITVVYAWSVDVWAGQQRGTFGDMFGGLNTVFSGLAFLGLIDSSWPSSCKCESSVNSKRNAR